MLHVTRNLQWERRRPIIPLAESSEHRKSIPALLFTGREQESHSQAPIPIMHGVLWPRMLQAFHKTAGLLWFLAGAAGPKKAILPVLITVQIHCSVALKSVLTSTI